MSKKMGAPSKFNDAIKSKLIELSEKGKTVDQIAEIIGCSKRTIYYWLGDDKDFAMAVREARQIADDLVEASLFTRALGYSHAEEKVFCDKGDIVTHNTIKHYPPDVTAAIFWLKNRQPKRWREKMPGENDAKVTLTGEDADKRIAELLEKQKSPEPAAPDPEEGEADAERQ